MATFKATLRKRKNKQGLYPIAIRITKNRKTTYLYTGQYIDEKFWDESNTQKIKKLHPNAKRLNNLIASKLAEANESVLEIETKPQRKSQVTDIKKSITSKYKSNSFYDFAEQHFKLLEKNKKFSRINSERPILNRIKKHHHNKELDFISITPLFLKGLIAHLRNSDTVGERSIANTLIFIRTLYNSAINQSLTPRENYPFGSGDGKIKIKIPESIKIGLNADEIKAIENFKSNKGTGLHHTKNVFLFSFYLAGMRVADVLKMKWSNIQDDRIYYRMNKNQKPLSLKISEKLNTILLDYKPMKESNDDYIFPELKQIDQKDPKEILRKTKTATKKLNRYLGQIADKLEIDKHVTMHISRHSFGNISSDKIPIQMLQKLYNHSNIRTTIQYQQNFIKTDLDDALDTVMNF